MFLRKILQWQELLLKQQQALCKGQHSLMEQQMHLRSDIKQFMHASRLLLNELDASRHASNELFQNKFKSELHADKDCNRVISDLDDLIHVFQDNKLILPDDGGSEKFRLSMAKTNLVQYIKRENLAAKWWNRLLDDLIEVETRDIDRQVFISHIDLLRTRVLDHTTTRRQDLVLDALKRIEQPLEAPGGPSLMLLCSEASKKGVDAPVALTFPTRHAISVISRDRIIELHIGTVQENESLQDCQDRLQMQLKVFEMCINALVQDVSIHSQGHLMLPNQHFLI
ncbi:hypothetical protein EDD86DRAFT_204589, partial [Gorgonomyces haynaldii]